MTKNKIITISALSLILISLTLLVFSYRNRKTDTVVTQTEIANDIILSNRFTVAVYDSNFNVVTDLVTSNQYVMYESKHGVALCNLAGTVSIVNTNPAITVYMPSGSLLK